MREATYTSGINRGVKARGVYAWKISDRFTAGVPDSYYSGNTADLWVEYKWVQALPKRVAPTPQLSKNQALWLKDQHERGRMVAVILGSPEGAVIYPGLSWESPAPTPKVVAKSEVIDWIVERVA